MTGQQQNGDGQPKQAKPGLSARKGILIGLGLSALLAVGLKSWITPSAVTDPPTRRISKAEDMLEIKRDGAFKVGQFSNVMGVKVVRLQHRKTRQEFVLVKGLDEGLSDRLMNEQLPRQAIQPMAENLIRLKNPKQAADLTIDKLETSDTEHVTMNHQPVPVRQVNITFHLSNDPQPRSYQGLITRLEGTGKDKALLISFDRQGEFKAELLPQFLDEVRLKG